MSKRYILSRSKGDGLMKWQRILITGASSGLGWALAKTLASPGVELILSGRNKDHLEKLALFVQEKGARASVCVADLATNEGLQSLIDSIEKNVPDLLIHNAGIGSYGKFADTDLEASLQIVQVNVVAIMKITHAWCHILREKAISGKVIFVSSIAGCVPCPGMSVYAASKAYITHFAESFRFEWKGQGISVLTVCPGHFATNFQKRAAGRALADPTSPAAMYIAKDIVRVMHREGVYIPMPWRVVLKLLWLIPKGVAMRYVQRRILANLEK